MVGMVPAIAGVVDFVLYPHASVRPASKAAECLFMTILPGRLATGAV